MFYGNPLLCVYPYIEIADPLHIRGEVLVPYSNLDAYKIPEELTNYLKEIADFFYWYRGNAKIANITCAFLPSSSSPKRQRDFVTHLEEIRQLFGYLICVPDTRPNFYDLRSNYEQADYYIFEPSPLWMEPKYLNCIQFTDTALEDDVRLTGYEHSLNGGPRWDIAKGCRIYPQSRSVSYPFKFYELMEQLRLFNQHPNILTLLGEDQIDINVEDRIFKAIEWYNRSCKADMSSDLSLSCLVVAFETLFRTQKKRNIKGSVRVSKTTKLFDSIQMFVGDVSRLQEWVEQFYNARSRIQHEGESSQLRFAIPKVGPNVNPETNEYGYLTHYGWLIFRICVNSVLSGPIQAAKIDLRSKFFDQQERLERILKNLTEVQDPYNSLITVLDDVNAIFRQPYPDFRPFKLETVCAIADKLAEQLLRSDTLRDDERIRIESVVTKQPAFHIEDSDKIIKHTILLLQNTAELPEDIVIKPALADLQGNPPPGLPTIKLNVEQILADNRNQMISANLRRRLLNIVELIDHSLYRSKLRLFTELAQEGDYISKRHLFSLIQGYSSFSKQVVDDSERNTDRYIIDYQYQVSNTGR